MAQLNLEMVGGAEKEFSALGNRKVQEAFAVDLDMIMNGLKPLSSSKPLNGLGKGVFELKKNGRPAYRCVYVVKNNTLYVLHVYSKTSDGTPKHHEDTIKTRFKSVK